MELEDSDQRNMEKKKCLKEEDEKERIKMSEERQIWKGNRMVMSKGKG